MLKERGVDAVLIVQKVDAKDGLPQTVHVCLYSTNQKGEIGVVDWNNGLMRRGAFEAAQDIAAAIEQDSWPPAGDFGDDANGGS
jgi:hypothetical protein